MTPEEFVEAAQQHMRSAKILLERKEPVSAWHHCGFAAEFLLKAAILRHTRRNRWPSREEDERLYTHDLFYLMQLAGIDRKSLTRDPIGPKFNVVLMWRRSDAYQPGKMPMRLANDMLQSLCGANGVAQWISKRYRLDI